MWLFQLSLLVCILATAATSAKGNADGLSWEVANFTDSGERFSTQDGYDETDFYYPTVEAGAPHDEESPNPFLFPLIVFLSGVMVDKSLYSNFGNLLASYGYVVAIPNHLQTLGATMPPGLWASQLTPYDVLQDVTERFQNESSPLFGIVDTTCAGISGHSNGGGAALFATSSHCQPPFCFGDTYERNDAFKAAVVVSTHLVPMGGPPGQADLEPVNVDNEIPVALINGDLDSMHDVCRSWPLIEEEKDLIILQGANHWAVTNIQNPPGNTPDMFSQTVSQEWSNEMCAKWTARAFDAYLKQERDFFDSLSLEAEGIDKGVKINQHCLMYPDTLGEDDSNSLSAGEEMQGIVITIISAVVSFMILVGLGLGYSWRRYCQKTGSPDDSASDKSRHDPTSTDHPGATHNENGKLDQDVADEVAV